MMLKSRIKESDEVDLTPMIDVVFQLIIFFMVVMAIAA
ncbi:MAG: biopolymer transporter ExbD, partial [Chitinivibrionales bacterium]|nr:biopolymer transporter ExbD [Chitinivibrionales bacterium]